MSEALRWSLLAGLVLVVLLAISIRVVMEYERGGRLRLPGVGPDRRPILPYGEEVELTAGEPVQRPVVNLKPLLPHRNTPRNRKG